MKFEAHITYEKSCADVVRAAAEKMKWKYSQIDGDPVYGDKVLCYLTSHSNDYDELLLELIAVANEVANIGAPWLRLKIEEIKFDKRK